MAMHPGNQSAAHPLSIARATSLLLGIIGGLIILVVVTMDTKWIVYAVGALIFLSLLFVIPNQEKLLWATFILSFQFDASIRILYGYAHSDGVVFPATFLAALALVGWYFFTGNIRRFAPVKWAGPLAIPIAVVFATAAISILTTSEQFVGLTTFFTYLQYYMIFWLALNFVTTEQDFDFILKFLFFVLAAQSVIYYIQSSLGFTFTVTGDTLKTGAVPRPGGTVATTPAGFASFILPILFIAVAHFVSRQSNKRYKRYAGIAAMLGVGALVITYTRGAWGSFALGLVWLLAVAYRRGILSMPKLSLLISIAGVAVVIAIPMILARLDGAPLDSSYQERFRLMQIAMIMIEAHPFTGVGLGAYEFTFKHYVPPELANAWLYTVHNDYLLRAAETGVLGGLGFIALLFAGLFQALRVSRSSSIALSHTALGIGAAIVALAFALYWEALIAFSYNALFWFLLGLLGAAEVLSKNSDAVFPAHT